MAPWSSQSSVQEVLPLPYQPPTGSRSHLTMDYIRQFMSGLLIPTSDSCLRPCYSAGRQSLEGQAESDSTLLPLEDETESGNNQLTTSISDLERDKIVESENFSDGEKRVRESSSIVSDF